MKSIYYKIRSLYLLLWSDTYILLSSRGATFAIPEKREKLEGLQDELEKIDEKIEAIINELILEERDGQ